MIAGRLIDPCTRTRNPVQARDAVSVLAGGVDGQNTFAPPTTGEEPGQHRAAQPREGMKPQELKHPWRPNQRHSGQGESANQSNNASSMTAHTEPIHQISDGLPAELPSIRKHLASRDKTDITPNTGLTREWVLRKRCSGGCPGCLSSPHSRV
jgi:hypothetical protein